MWYNFHTTSPPPPAKVSSNPGAPMQEQRQHFRYQFPQTTNTICTDDKGRRLIPIDISDGGIGFYAETSRKVGTIENIHLLDFVSLQVKITNEFPGQRGGDDKTPLYKVGAIFVDCNLTPQKFIEFLEVNMLKGSLG